MKSRVFTEKKETKFMEALDESHQNPMSNAPRKRVLLNCNRLRILRALVFRRSH